MNKEERRLAPHKVAVKNHWAKIQKSFLETFRQSRRQPVVLRHVYLARILLKSLSTTFITFDDFFH